MTNLNAGPDNSNLNDTDRTNELSLEDFSITELEDRLEFLDRCNPNCSC
jgi:hypothetical protein